MGLKHDHEIHGQFESIIPQEFLMESWSMEKLMKYIINKINKIVALLHFN